MQDNRAKQGPDVSSFFLRNQFKHSNNLDQVKSISHFKKKKMGIKSNKRLSHAKSLGTIPYRQKFNKEEQVKKEKHKVLNLSGFNITQDSNSESNSKVNNKTGKRMSITYRSHGMSRYKKERLSSLLRQSFKTKFDQTKIMFEEVDQRRMKLKREFVFKEYSKLGFNYDSGFGKDILKGRTFVNNRRQAINMKRQTVKISHRSSMKSVSKKSFRKLSKSHNLKVLKNKKVKTKPRIREIMMPAVVTNVEKFISKAKPNQVKVSADMKQFENDFDSELIAKKKLLAEMLRQKKIRAKVKSLETKARVNTQKKKNFIIHDEGRSELKLEQDLEKQNYMGDCLSSKYKSLQKDVTVIRKKIRTLKTWDKVQVVNQELGRRKLEEIKVNIIKQIIEWLVIYL